MGIFYVKGESLLGEVAALVPLPRMRTRELFSRLGVVTKAVAKGVGLTCLAQGALGGVGFWVAGLPSPLLFGTVMAFSGLIPVVGTAIVWVPGVLYLFFTGQTAWGVGLSIWCALVVGNIDNVLRPLLIGGNAGMPLPLLLVGILGGLFAYGLMGLIIGPLILTVLLFRPGGVPPGGSRRGGTAPSGCFRTAASTRLDDAPPRACGSTRIPGHPGHLHRIRGPAPGREGADRDEDPSRCPRRPPGNVGIETGYFL